MAEFEVISEKGFVIAGLNRLNVIVVKGEEVEVVKMERVHLAI